MKQWNKVLLVFAEATAVVHLLNEIKCNQTEAKFTW
jgi:hypothetical protein